MQHDCSQDPARMGKDRGGGPPYDYGVRVFNGGRRARL